MIKKVFLLCLLVFNLLLHANVNNKALIIGINDYITWNPLEFAIADAELIKKELSKQNFDTTFMNQENATKEKIYKQLSKFKNKNIHRLIIYFAGHGHTITNNSKKEGYLIPIDSKWKEYDKYAISMVELKKEIKKLNVKHILLIFDSCYSGLGLTRKGMGDSTLKGYLKEVDQMDSIQILTAGRMGDLAQEKDGNGLFTKFFVKAMSGEADANDDGVLTASEINQWVRPMVYEESGNEQLPMYGSLYGEGEFLFTNFSSKVKEKTKEIKKEWVKESQEKFENSRGNINLNTLKNNTLFSKLVKTLEIEESLNSKSFLLNTLNFAVKPTDIPLYTKEDINKANKLNNEGTKLYKNYYRTWNKKLLHKSIEQYYQALKYDNSNAQIYSNLALAFYRNKNFEYAVWAGLESIKKGNSEDIIASSLYNIGRVFEDKKEYEKSLIFYLSSLKLRKPNTQTYNIVKSRIQGIYNIVSNNDSKRKNTQEWVAESRKIVNLIDNKKAKANLIPANTNEIFERLINILEIERNQISQTFLYNTLEIAKIPSVFEELKYAYDEKKADILNKKAENLYTQFKKTKDKKLMIKAIDNYYKSISYNPSNAQVYSNLSLAYLKNKEYNYSIWAALESIKKTTQRNIIASSLYNIGRVFEDTKKYEESLIFYIASLNLREKGKIYNIVRERIDNLYKKINS